MAILFHDPIPIIRAYLGRKLAGIPVSTVTPGKFPDRSITVTATGGTRADVAHETSLLAVQAWAKTPTGAARLARETCAHLRDLADTNGQVTWIEASTPYEFPDPQSDYARYQMTLQIQTRPEQEI